VVAGRSDPSDDVTLTRIWIRLSNGPSVMAVFAVIGASGTVGLVLEVTVVSYWQ
jgi:hypothetical protein